VTAAKRNVSRDASILVVGNVLATIADIITPIAILRLVGKADVAALSGLLLVYNTMALLLLAGFHQTITFFLPGRAIEERAAIARKVVRLLMMLGVVGAAILLLVGRFGTPLIELVADFDGAPTDLSPLMFLLLFPLGDLPARILPNLAVVEHRPRTAAAYGVFRSLTVSLSTLLPIAFGYSPDVVAMSMSVVALGQLVFVRTVMRRCYADVERVASPVSTGELVKFGLPLGATDMVSSLNNRFDQLLVVLSFPAHGYAVYKAGAYQIPVVTRLPYLVATALAPQLVEAYREGRTRDAIAAWRQSIGKVSLLVVPVTLVFFVGAEAFILLIGGPDYIEAVPVFRWYTLLSIVRVAAFGTVIVAAGRPKYVLHAALFSFAFNVLLSVPLLMIFGFVGPAMGTALAFFPMAIFYCSRIAKASEIPLRDIFPLAAYFRVLGVALVGAAAGWMFAETTDFGPWIELFGVAGIVLGSFAVLGTATRTISGEDWAFVTAKLRRKR
jgi:O-antigen/teichoic acid export membrane protein